MQVPPAGTGAIGPGRAEPNQVALPASLPAALERAESEVGDSVGALLGELSQSDLTRLFEILKAIPQPGDEAQEERLLRAAEEAIGPLGVGSALDFLRQLAHLDPVRAEALGSVPALESIRPEIEQLLSQLTAVARLHAEGRLAEATQKLETAGVQYKPATQVRPDVFLLVATRLMESGGLANYVRSASVSEDLIRQCTWAPAEHTEAAPVNPRSDDWQVRTGFLIAVWFAIGLAGVVLCWWLRDEWLPIVCGAWACVLAVLMAIFSWRGPRRS